MKNAIVLSKAEMKNVIGGVMDKETTLQYCLDHIVFEEDPIVNEIILSVGTQICYDNYNRMIS